MTPEDGKCFDRRRDLLFVLLGLAESLRDAMAEGEPPEVWREILAERNAVYAELVRVNDAVPSLAPALDAAARSALVRLVELDAAILAAGRVGMEEIARERHALEWRRRAVVAHGARERDVPRAVTLKV